MSKKIESPFTGEAVKQLKVGELVSVSGRIFTGRDRLHKYLHEGGKPPVDLKNGAIFHCGPVMISQNGQWIPLAAGPTTSARQDPYMPGIIESYHIRLIIGKGGMGEATRAACRKQGCVYLQAVGGAAGLLAEKIKKVESVHFLKEFGAADALWELTVQDFEAVVAMDAHGHSLHKKIRTASRQVLLKMINGQPS